MAVLSKEIPQDNPEWDKLTNQIVGIMRQYEFAPDLPVTWDNLKGDLQALQRSYAILREIPIVQGRGVHYFDAKAIFPNIEITYQCYDGGEDIVLNVSTR